MKNTLLQSIHVHYTISPIYVNDTNSICLLFDFDLIISCFVKFHFQVYSLFVIHNRIVLNKERSILFWEQGTVLYHIQLIAILN